MTTIRAPRSVHRQAYILVLAVALAWAAGNCVYVYAVLGGAKVYRLETAILALLVAILPMAIQRAQHTTSPVPLARRGLVTIGTAAGVGWASLYLYLINYPFLSDDYVFLDLYRQFSDIGKVRQFFRPLFTVVFWSLRALFVVSPVPFHVLSMALHAGSAFMVYRLCLTLFGATGPAILAGSLFLVNPLQLEASLWISGLQDVLWSFFILAALAYYTQKRELSLIRVIVTCLLVACGLLSKEAAVSYILLLPAFDLIVFRFKRGPLLGIAYGVFSMELIGYLILRGQVTPIEATYFVTPTRYFVKQFIVTPYRYFIHPWNQSAVHVDGLMLAAVSVAVLFLFTFAVWQRRRSSRVFAGAFFILAVTLPVYSYFYVASDLTSSRYLYCAAAGWAIIVAEMVATAVPRPKVFVAVAVALTAASASSLYLNARPWLMARDVINALEVSSAAGSGVDAELRRLRAMNHPGMTWKDDVPYTYKGVGIFINGYNEFLKITRENRRSR